MAEPDWHPDTAGRSLAEILREANIESATRAARRRSWDDPEETGIRQRRAEAAAADRAAGFGRRKSDLDDAPPPRDRPDFSRPAPGGANFSRPAPEPHTAAIPGMRPDRKPGVPTASAAPAPVAPVRDRRAPAHSAPQRVARERGGLKRGAPERQAPEQGTAQRGADRRQADRRSERPVRAADHPVTGPIPVVRPGRFDEPDIDDADDSTPRESALAWLRFGGELVIALAAGVGVYFAATVLWEMLPHVAALLAPLAVTGLVGGVGMWRHKQGREPVGPRLLAILVFAGTLLTIFPAAELLSRGS
jgi:hypothetical protein